MWGLIESLILWNAKKKSVPLYFLIVLMLAIFLLMEFWPEQAKQAQNLENPQAYVNSEQTIESAPKALIPATPEPTPTPKHETPPVVQKEESHEDAVHNSETTRNFTLFSDMLSGIFKQKGLDENLSRNLAAKIQQNLREEKASVEDLEAAIAEELGPGASESDKILVKNLVVEALTKVTELQTDFPK